MAAATTRAVELLDTDIKIPNTMMHEGKWTAEAAKDLALPLPEGVYFNDSIDYVCRVGSKARVCLQFATSHVNRLRSYLRDHADTNHMVFMGSLRVAGANRRSSDSIVLFHVPGGKEAVLAAAKALATDMHIVRVTRRIFVLDGVAPDLPAAVEAVASAAAGLTTPQHTALLARLADPANAVEGESQEDRAARFGLSLSVMEAVEAGRVPVRFNVAPRGDLGAVVDAIDTHPVLAGATKDYVALTTFLRLEGVPGVFYSLTPPDCFFGHVCDTFNPAAGAVSRAYYKLREGFLRGGIATADTFLVGLAQPQREKSKEDKVANWGRKGQVARTPATATLPEEGQVPKDTAPPAAERVEVEWECYGPEGPPHVAENIHPTADVTRDARAPMCTAPVRVGIDVGAAPGGWSRVLASTLSAQLVLSVDPAAMDPDLPPNVLHIRQRFQQALSELAAVYGTRKGAGSAPAHAPGAPLPRYIDCYVCDMNVQIEVSLRLLWQALPLLTGGARLALTVKNFNGTAGAWRDGVRHCTEAIGKACLPGSVRRFHLFSNGREEQTLTGLLRPAAELDALTDEVLEGILATKWVGDKLSSDPVEIKAFQEASAAARRERDARRRALTKGKRGSKGRRSKVARREGAGEGDAASAAGQ